MGDARPTSTHEALVTERPENACATPPWCKKKRMEKRKAEAEGLPLLN
jgi:hypothetical protein